MSIVLIVGCPDWIVKHECIHCIYKCICAICDLMLLYKLLWHEIDDCLLEIMAHDLRNDIFEKCMVLVVNGYSHSLHGATRRGGVVGFYCERGIRGLFSATSDYLDCTPGRSEPTPRKGVVFEILKWKNLLAGFRLGSAKRKTEVISMGPLWFSERILDVDAYFASYLIYWKMFRYIWNVIWEILWHSHIHPSFITQLYHCTPLTEYFPILTPLFNIFRGSLDLL